MNLPLSTRFILLLVFLRPPPAMAAAKRFQHWFPDYEPLFVSLIENNCAREYDAFVHNQVIGPNDSGIPLRLARYRLSAAINT
jgi:hypothetical protein